MKVEEMREKIRLVYPDSMKWRLRVAYMSDKQVIAIYYSFLKSRKFDVLKKKKGSKEPVYEQMTIFDYGVKI